MKVMEKNRTRKKKNSKVRNWETGTPEGYINVAPVQLSRFKKNGSFIYWLVLFFLFFVFNVCWCVAKALDFSAAN